MEPVKKYYVIVNDKTGEIYTSFQSYVAPKVYTEIGYAKATCRQLNRRHNPTWSVKEVELVFKELDESQR